MKPAIMELGGHAPVIVCEDIDPVASAGTSALAKSRNAGQVCVSPTRFFVEDAIYDRFADAFAEKAKAIKVGNGLDPDNQMGPLANAPTPHGDGNIGRGRQGQGRTRHRRWCAVSAIVATTSR